VQSAHRPNPCLPAPNNPSGKPIWQAFADVIESKVRHICHIHADV
jgi:hypothetical protein